MFLKPFFGWLVGWLVGSGCLFGVFLNLMFCFFLKRVFWLGFSGRFSCFFLQCFLL